MCTKLYYSRSQIEISLIETKSRQTTIFRIKLKMCFTTGKSATTSISSPRAENILYVTILFHFRHTPHPHCPPPPSPSAAKSLLPKSVRLNSCFPCNDGDGLLYKSFTVKPPYVGTWQQTDRSISASLRRVPS
jgi:hypothetical protein